MPKTVRKCISTRRRVALLHRTWVHIVATWPIQGAMAQITGHIQIQLEMWADAQRGGRPAEYMQTRWLYCWNAHNTVLGEEARLIYIVPLCYVKTGRYGKT